MHGEPVFPYVSPRPGQMEIAEIVAKAVREGRVLVLQAPTGYGKTAAVIYGLVKAEVDKVLYLVRTRNEIAPVLRELKAFNQPFTFLYSARRMCPLYNAASDDLTVEEFWEACRVLRVKGLCTHYENVLQASTDEIENVIKEGAPDPFLAASSLAHRGLCPFFALKLLMSKARFIVATYPYFFKQDIFDSIFSPMMLEDLVVVVDEAHSLMDLHTTLEVKLRVKDLELAARELSEYAPESEELLKKVKALADYMRSLKSSISTSVGYVRVDKERVKSLLGGSDVWSDAAYEVRLRKLESALESTAILEAVRSYAARVAEFAKALDHEHVMVYASLEGGHVALHAIPLDPEAVAGKRLSSVKAAILMSGTMPPHDYFARSLGISKPLSVYDLELAGKRWPPTRRYYAIVVAELSSKYVERGNLTYMKYAEYIAEAFRAVDGALLVVYPSYEFMLNVLKHLKLPSSSMITEERTTEITEVRRQVLRHRHVIINAVAGAKLVEGVEVVENGRSLIRGVFLAGVPYPQPDDMLKDYVERVSRRSSISSSSVFNVIASIRARQALGRALRSEHDYAVYILADRRFLSRELRDLMKVKVDRVVYDLSSFREALRAAAAGGLST